MDASDSPASSHGKIQYSRIHGEEGCDFNDGVHQKQNTRWHRILTCSLSIICLGLVAFLISTYHLAVNRPCICSDTNDVGSDLLMNNGLSIINKIAIPYHYLELGFDNDDFAVGDPYWAGMFPVGEGLVFLTQEYITSRRLPMSAVSPNREGNRSVYEIAGYHSLHCLSVLRENIWKARSALKEGKPWDLDRYWLHTKHCLADLRQYIMCNFDETLLFVEDLIHHPGQQQLKLCKKMGPIDKWLEENYGPVEQINT